MESINMFFIVVLAAVANGHVIQRPLEINNEHNQPIRVIVNNGTRVTLRNIGRENFSVNGRRFVPLRPVRPVTTTTPEPGKRSLNEYYIILPAVYISHLYHECSAIKSWIFLNIIISVTKIQW